MRLGFGEILVILVVVLLVFGPNKLPQLGEALGKSIRNFKKATEDADAEGESKAQLPAQGTDAAESTVASEAKKV